MAKNLVIVESPSKSKTIEKYLGSDFKVLSSKGHIRDLATTGAFGFGVDVENNFEANYKAAKGKSKTITELKKASKEAEFVYLATDPDREGEAISWHIKDSLGLTEDDYDRVVFNEITKKAVTGAFEHARKIDQNLVDSQESRRILDRIIGFRLSKLMQKKTGGKSAGRVQSVALKLIVDREREIEAFITDEYWEIEAKFTDFEAKLEKYKTEKVEIKNEGEATAILNQLSPTFDIENVEQKRKKKQPRMPFITSTLQQEAASKLNFGAKRTMSVAQKLYEGKDLANETVGLITYMRTDSTRLSSEFIAPAMEHIKNVYGDTYVGVVRKGKTKDNVQDAHEGIRPTSINRTPEQVKSYLSDDEFKLYSLIYARALASLMAPAVVNQTSVTLTNNDYKFKATGQIITFDGYLKVYGEYESTSDKILPPFENYHSSVLVSSDIEKTQHFTKPPARYSEAKLIKDMEELGIGRPSTYAPTMDTLKMRNYVEIIEKKFKPTEVGLEITDRLQEYFNWIINVKYTAQMETDLDNIAQGEKEEVEFLRVFYQEFAKAVEEAFENMDEKELEKTGEECPECGHDLVIRVGKFGKFTACSNFPECKYIKQDEKEINVVMDCPNCADGKIVEKRTRKGKVMYGCNNFPKCKTAFWDQPIERKCDLCGSHYVIKGKKELCSNKDCENSK